MLDTELYAAILGVKEPWRVGGVELRLEGGEVEVFVEHGGEGRLACPECGEPASRYDKRERRWRHLDTCQYRTILVAQVPRVECSEHGVKTIQVPWAEPGSPFTALFEALVIDWLRAANTRAAARLVGLSWDQVDGVMQRAVRRGLERRELAAPQRVGVDEWLYHPERLPEKHRERFDALVAKALKTSRAWMLKELAMEMWEASGREQARQIFAAWYSWAIRSRLEPVKRVARVIKRHLTGILNALAHRITNARIEGLNTKIQWLKRSARGFRNRDRFRNAIYFHLGGLDLYPASLTHLNS